MKWMLWLWCCAIGILAFPQQSTLDLEQFAERLFQMQEEDLSYEDIYESLLLNYSNPLNLNKVTQEELASLYILSPLQLNNFFTYRDQFGDFLSVNELQAIPSFDVDVIRMLQPFITLEESASSNQPFLNRLINEENNYLLLRYSRRLEKVKGYTPPSNNSISRYKGSPDKLYGRFRTSRKNDFSLGFTFEKDAGEPLTFENSPPGFDFYSYHLLLENKFGLDDIILGDFQLQVGQGIVFGAGFNAGKGAETVNTTKRSTLGIRPYTSVLESGFFRGVGMSKSIKNFHFMLFYSQAKQDGTIQNDTTYSDFEAYIHSIQQTGLHRTSNEILGKNRVAERAIGGYFQFQPNRKLLIALAGLTSNYSTPIQRKPSNYNQFEFEGNQNEVISIFGNYTWQNIAFFGEMARSRSGGTGMVSGVMASLSKNLDFSLVLRNYERDFHSFYGNAFSENSRIINEKGVYWGLGYKISRHHQFNLYYDYFQFPWLKFRTETPSVGNEWLIRYTYTPNKALTLYTQVRQQAKQVTVAKENLRVLADQIKYNYFLHIDYKMNAAFALKMKIQTSTLQEADTYSNGFAIVQDVNFQTWKLKVATRMALFETDNFANAQYIYENDVLYSFSIPAYYGTGIRNYVMIRFDPMRKLSVWLRYSRFQYKNRETIGTGLEESLQPRNSEVKMMVRYQF